MSNKIYVKIGRKYRDAFQSVCDLVNNGCIDPSIIQSCRDDRFIETSQYIFEYTGETSPIGAGTDVGMMPSGASWFMGFRGSDSSNVMSAWHNLVETVADNYHKEFSLVEYLQSANAKSAEEIAESTLVVENAVRALKIPFSKVSNATTEESLEDLYAVSLRMELFGGAGEPRPILCKVYFRYQNKVFSPLRSDESSVVDVYIQNIISNQRGVRKDDKDGPKAAKGQGNGEEGKETTIVDNVLNSIEKLIRGDLSRSFTESVLISNETDTETIADLVKMGPQDEVQLSCKRLKVLGISHITWVATAFNVYLDGQKAFLAKVGLNDSISLYCCCRSKENKLIENNVIPCVSEETGESYEIHLDPQQEDFGITESDVERIRKESPFAEHVFPINCPEMMRRNINCTQYRCNCNTITFEAGGKIRRKCADCPHPEIVFRYGDGNVSYTPSLGFDTKTLSPVETPTAVCRFCGRSYAVKEATANYMCEFCRSAFDSFDQGMAGKAEHRTYRRYAGMLPLSVRVRALFGKKFCFENADRLLFFVGNDQYFFDKLKLTDTGLIEKPEKRQ